MHVNERLEQYLRKNMGEVLPEIRYFNGNDDEGKSAYNRNSGLPFSCADGSFAASSLEGSLDLFLKSKGF
jgi:hypothetical protein